MSSFPESTVQSSAISTDDLPQDSEDWTPPSTNTTSQFNSTSTLWNHTQARSWNASDFKSFQGNDSQINPTILALVKDAIKQNTTNNDTIIEDTKKEQNSSASTYNSFPLALLLIKYIF